MLGTLRVLEAARAATARRSSSAPPAARSTASASGRPARTTRASRSSPYGTSKLAGEEYLATWNRLHGTRNVALRFANVFGPRQLAKLEGGVVAIFMDRLRAGEPVTIFGDGEQTRDFVYVGDVVAAMLAAAARDGGGVFNVGTGVETSVNAALRRLPRDGRRGRRAGVRAGARGRPAPQRARPGRAPSASSAGGRRSRSSPACAETWAWAAARQPARPRSARAAANRRSAWSSRTPCPPARGRPLRSSQPRSPCSSSASSSCSAVGLLAEPRRAGAQRVAVERTLAPVEPPAAPDARQGAARARADRRSSS